MIYAILLSILVGLALSYSQLQEIYNFLRAKSTLDSSGQVKVNGVVKANVITSPLSQSPCALWKVEVTHWSGGRHARETSILSKSSDDSFVVKDGENSFQINPTHAKLELKPSEHTWTAGMWWNPVEQEGLDPKIKEAILAMGVSLPAVQEKLGVRVYESFVQAGDEILLAGNISSQGGVETFVSDEEVPLTISEWDEGTILGKLYRRVAYNLGAALVIGIMGYILFFTPKK